MDMWFWGVRHFLKMRCIVKVRGEVQRFIFQCLSENFQATLNMAEEGLLRISFYVLFV